MLDLAGNFSGVAEECAKAPVQFQRSCFESMGRTVSGRFERDAEESIAACRIIPDAAQADFCIIGALHDQFWDETQSGGAVIFCSILEGTKLEQDCYREIVQRSTSVIPDGKSRAKFCGRLPGNYRKSCLAEQPLPFETASEKIPIVAEEKDASWPTIGSAIIRFNGSDFVPDEITVRAGSAVVFVNGGAEPFWPASNIHPTHEIYPEFDPGRPIGPGGNWSFDFDKAGVWRFHDHWYPKAGGTITVR